MSVFKVLGLKSLRNDSPAEPTVMQMLVNQLLDNIHPNYSIEALVEEVARLRKRPIQLCPWPMNGITEFGAWIAGPVSDYIFYDHATAAIHQWQIIAHELAHMLLGHRTGQVGRDPEMSVAGFVLKRSGNAAFDRREQQAEQLATLLQAQIIQRGGLTALTRQLTTVPAWQGLSNGLGLNDLHEDEALSHDQ